MRELSNGAKASLYAFSIVHKTDMQFGTPPRLWGVSIMFSLDDDDRECIAAGYAAENPLNNGNYYLTRAGGAYLNEDIVTPFDTEEATQ